MAFPRGMERNFITQRELTEALDSLVAWEEYDTTRCEYECLVASWHDAQTTASAEDILRKLLIARTEYIEALSVLRKRGYDPSGCDPEPEKRFTDPWGHG